MTRRVTPPFRADHVGSLLRPAALLAARDDFAAGKLGAAELAATEDAAIRDVVKLQEGAGLQSATDGEFRRLCISGQCGFASTVEGNSLTIDEERAKLGLLVETASEIWG